MRVKRFNRLFPVVAVVCLALAVVPGCKKGRATVKGKVTFNGQPVKAGTVSFYASPSVVGTGNINPDGTYEVKDAPVGEVTVTVSTPPPLVGPVQMGKPPPGMKMPTDMVPSGPNAAKPVSYMPIPDKYKARDQSPLKTTVNKGENDYDIKLTP